MKGVIAIRVDSSLANLIFQENELRDVGSSSVVEVLIDENDPRIDAIGRLDLARRAGDVPPRLFYTSTRIRRTYTAAEIAAAELFHMIVNPPFEPAGEECGTHYDEAATCPRCKAPAVQLDPLRLPKSKIPRSRDFTCTIVGELVASARFVGIVRANGLTGLAFDPILSPRKGEPLDGWVQPRFLETRVQIAPPTRYGISLFEPGDQGVYSCPDGHTLGLNLVSEPSVARTSLAATDFMATEQHFGWRMGLLRPERVYLVSPRAHRILVAEKVKGIRLERALVV